jgi:hypothetical protein
MFWPTKYYVSSLFIYVNLNEIRQAVFEKTDQILKGFTGLVQ